jgi:hypothetical protein
LCLSSSVWSENSRRQISHLNKIKEWLVVFVIIIIT